MKSYKDLDIYKESKQLAIEVHKLSVLLPKFELYEEGAQIRRSSKAITSLICEGYGRGRYKGEFIKYLVYAYAECEETLVHLEFLFETGSFTEENKYLSLKESYILLSKKIFKFINWVEQHWNNTE
jgi:four helix bundle protein